MNALSSCLRLGSVGVFLLTFTALAHGQFIDLPSGGDPGKHPGSHPPIDLQIAYSTTAARATEFRGHDRKDSGAESFSVSLQGRIPLSPPHWLMPLGLESQNVYFDEVPGAPLPEAAHTLSFTTGVGYRPDGDWMFMARLNPTLYRTSQIGSDDLGVSGGLIALWRQSPTLTWMFGVMVSPDGEFPVLPAVGANWAITPDLTLSLMVPRPQVIYRLNPQWSLRAGASLDGATFRTSETFGAARGEPRYNHALASYRDIRIGAGFDVKLTPRLLLQADGGYSVNRQIDYTRIDERVKFDSAPFLQVGLRVTF